MTILFCGWGRRTQPPAHHHRLHQQQQHRQRRNESENAAERRRADDRNKNMMPWVLRALQCNSSFRPTTLPPSFSAPSLLLHLFHAHSALFDAVSMLRRPIPTRRSMGFHLFFPILLFVSGLVGWLVGWLVGFGSHFFTIRRVSSSSKATRAAPFCKWNEITTGTCLANNRILCLSFSIFLLFSLALFLSFSFTPPPTPYPLRFFFLSLSLDDNCIRVDHGN